MSSSDDLKRTIELYLLSYMSNKGLVTQALTSLVANQDDMQNANAQLSEIVPNFPQLPLVYSLPMLVPDSIETVEDTDYGEKLARISFLSWPKVDFVYLSKNKEASEVRFLQKKSAAPVQIKSAEDLEIWSITETTIQEQLGDPLWEDGWDGNRRMTYLLPTSPEEEPTLHLLSFDICLLQTTSKIEMKDKNYDHYRNAN